MSYTIGIHSNAKGSNEVSQKQATILSPLKRVISLCEELEQQKRRVAKAEQELYHENQKLGSINETIKEEVARLDPSTKDLFRGILGQIDGEIKVDLGKDDSLGRTR